MPQCPRCKKPAAKDELCAECKKALTNVDAGGYIARIANARLRATPRIKAPIGGRAQPRVVEKAAEKAAPVTKEALRVRMAEFAPRYKAAMVDAKQSDAGRAQTLGGLYAQLTQESKDEHFDLAMRTLGAMIDLVDGNGQNAANGDVGMDLNANVGVDLDAGPDIGKAEARRERFAKLEARIDAADKVLKKFADDVGMLLWDEDEADEAEAGLNELEQRVIVGEQDLARKDLQNPETMKLTKAVDDTVSNLKKAVLGMGAAAAAVIEREYQACLQLTDVKARRETLAALVKRGNDATFLALSASRVAIDIPQRQKEFRRRVDAAAQSPTGDPALKAELDKLISEAPQKAQVAKKFVTEKSDQELKALGVDKKIALVTFLRQGDEKTLPERRKALAKLYSATELDDKFLAGDNDKRDNVLKSLQATQITTSDGQKRELSTIRKDWAKVGKEDRQLVLKDVLRIQCEQMKINPPEVKMFSEPSSKVSEDKQVECAGYHQNGVIFVNDVSDSFDDFDDLLDTVIHENTHNYQRELVIKLEAGELEDENGNKSDEYDQAVMFQLNSGDAHFEGSATDTGGYMACPKERHAWLAGGEASKLFVDDARAEGEIFLAQLSEWSTKNPDDAKDVELYTKQLKKTLGNEEATGSQIAKQIRHFSYALKKSAAARSGETMASNAQADANVLKFKIESWGNSQDLFTARAVNLNKKLEADLAGAKSRDEYAAAVQANQQSFDALKKEAEQAKNAPKQDIRAPYREKVAQLAGEMRAWAKKQADTSYVGIIENDIKALEEQIGSKPIKSLDNTILNFRRQFETRQ